MKFKSRKDTFFSMIIIGISLFLTIVAIIGISSGKWLMVLYFMFVGFLLWILFDTQYELSRTHLKYRQGPIKGAIEISQKSKIIKGKVLLVGIKPATARSGLIITYNKYDDIYISPKTNESFIAELLSLNNEIEIIE